LYQHVNVNIVSHAFLIDSDVLSIVFSQIIISVNILSDVCDSYVCMCHLTV